MHPRLRHWADEMHATLARLLLYLGALAALTVAAGKFLEVPEGQAALESAAAGNDWIEVGKPFPAFQLILPDGNESEPFYAIHRHAQGGRKDILSYGGMTGSLSQVVVEIYRPGSEMDRFADAATEVTGRALELGSVEGLHAVDPIASKFGPFEAFAFLLRRPRGAHRCLAFARAFEDPRLQIAGRWCKGERDLVDASAIACALDRLTLLAAGSDPKAAELFAVAERDRTFCGQPDPLLAARIKRPDVVTGGREARLRGQLVAR